MTTGLGEHSTLPVTLVIAGVPILPTPGWAGLACSTSSVSSSPELQKSGAQ